jgi:hypothetical protein
MQKILTGGAGGAGGYRTSTQTVTSGGTVITVTVGDGGAGSATLDRDKWFKFINIRFRINNYNFCWRRWRRWS